MFIASSILDSFDNVPNWIRMTIFIGLFFAYEPFCLAFGCTIGNYIKKIRVKSFNDTDSRINILQALIRYLFKILLGWISFLTIHSTPGRRAIHDLISGSVMIKV
jgi:uncharacterized RDD family membrane protein YckC